MTSSIKNSPELDSSGKSGSPSQTSQSGNGQSPRSNPVCLEVGVTLRSLPSEAGGAAQPLREEVKTVIVFDNGAVLRSTNSLAAGLTLIISNSGRDVVCKVVGGRNLPSVKGYVEVEFLETVQDFWNIHQDGAAPAIAAPPAAAPIARETPAPPAPKPTPLQAAPPRPAPTPEPLRKPVSSIEPPPKPLTASSASTPSFDEFPGPTSVPPYTGMQESKPEPKREPPSIAGRTGSDYDHSNVADSTSVANWTPPGPETFEEKPAFPAPRASSTASSSPSGPTRDFMSKGLMAYDQGGDSSGASGSRTPLIVGAAAVVLAAIGGTYFFMHRTSTPPSVANATAPATMQPAKAEPPVVSSAPAPAPIQAAKDVTPPATAAAPQPQVQPVSAEPAQPAVKVASIPAATSSASATNSPRSGSKSTRQPGKVDAAAKQPAPSAPAPPAITNLKMSSPSRPTKTLADAGDAAAPVAEIPSAVVPVGSTPASLLTSGGRTSNAPAPPPALTPAPPPVAAPKTVTDPKLISSTRLAYPPSARQANIQGTVTVSAIIDEAGKVISARAISGPILLRAAAEDSVKQWKYSPGTVDGKPAISRVTVNLDFKLN